MGRIAERFAELKAAGSSGFVAYVTAGDPEPAALPEILAALDVAGTDVIELGIPFSDPLADGPTIQEASGRALAAGMTVARCLEAVRDFRTKSQTPLVLFTYLNPIFAYGFERFALDAEAAGADGLLVLDLPPEEQGFGLPEGMDGIRLIAPTTPAERMRRICAGATGFVYYVSREGVTGERTEMADGLESRVAELKSLTDLPVAVGFGISTPEQCARVAGIADAAVVGSAIVKRIAEARAAGSDLGETVAGFVTPLALAAHGARRAAKTPCRG